MFCPLARISQNSLSLGDWRTGSWIRKRHQSLPLRLGLSSKWATFMLWAKCPFNLAREQECDQCCCQPSSPFTSSLLSQVCLCEQEGHILPRSDCHHLHYSQKQEILPITKPQSKSTLWRHQNNNNTILPRLAQTCVSMDLWIWESILKQSGCAVGRVDISVLTDSAPLTGSSAQGAESQPCFLLLKRSLMLLSDNSLPAASRPLFWSQLSEWWGWLRLEQWAPFVLLKGDRKHWFQPLPGL